MRQNVAHTLTTNKTRIFSNNLDAVNEIEFYVKQNPLEPYFRAMSMNLVILENLHVSLAKPN